MYPQMGDHLSQQIFDNKSSDITVGDIIRYIAIITQGASIPDKIADPNLVQAIRLIRQVVSSNDVFGLDIRADNCMIRNTSVGPQLVITDPIVDMGESIAGPINPWRGDR